MQKSESRRVRRSTVAGAIFLVAGLLLLAAAGAYYTYATVAKSNLEELVYSGERPSAPLLDDAHGPASDARAVGTVTTVPSPEVGVRRYPGAAPSTPIDGTSRVTDQPAGDVAVAKAEAAGPLELGTGDAPSRTPSAPIAVQGAGTVQTFGELGKAGGTSAPSAAPIDPATSNPTPGLDDRVSPEDIGRLNESIAAAQGDAGSQGSASSDTVGSASAASQTPAQADGTGPGYERTAPAASVSSPFEDMRAESARLAPPALTGLTDGHLPASRISISSIGLDSKVKELEIVVREDSLAWETPKHVAGHIPTTALPGERGQGWYFGHLESPIRGEGNVFRRLPEIPGLLRSGEPVYILLEAAERQYRYRVYKTELVHQDDLRITNSGDQDITLVTCFPTLVYDHRLLVTAALIGVVES